MVVDDLVHPLPLHLEYLNRCVHQFSQILEEEIVIPPSEVSGTRAVEGDNLPGAHGEVLTVPEAELVVELIVATECGCKLICAALIA
jgi:hypothetical protein